MDRPRTLDIVDSITATLGGKKISHNSPDTAQVLGMACGALMWEINQAIPEGKNILAAEYTGLRKTLDIFIMGAVSKENMPYFLKGREAFMRDLADIKNGKVDPHAE